MYTTRILIQNGRIWDGEKFLQGDVALNEGGIVAVGDVGDFEPQFTFDAKGDIVAPGLTDIHTHMRYLASPTFEIHGEAVCFPNGVTSAAEAGVQTENDYCDYTTLRIRLFPKASIKEGKADLTKAERLIQYHGDRVVGIKVYFDKGMIGECNDAPLKEICDYAHARGLKVMVHCTNTPIPMAEMLACLSKGDICTHYMHGIGHTAAEDNFECLRDAKRRGVILDAGLAGGVHTNFELAKNAIRSGILPDTISTDFTCSSAFKRGGKYGMTYAMSMLRHFGMEEEDILRAVTSSAARAIGLEDTCGTLAVGRPSDVTILRYTETPMEMTDKNGNLFKEDQGYLCMLTISDGYVVYRSDLFH